jgi:uncharacterized protein YdhG (YjbR/CyaY superfamily)
MNEESFMKKEERRHFCRMPPCKKPPPNCLLLGAASYNPASVKSFTTIDAYLASVPEPARTTLQKIRATIRSVVPAEAIETICYGIPTFKYKQNVIHFAAFTNHCSLFPTASIIAMFKEELKRYPTSKGTIQFPAEKPVPAALIKKMVKARLAQIESKQPARRT